jgi:hypothetical protein
VTHRENSYTGTDLHCVIKGFHDWLALNQKAVEFRAQYRQIESKPKRLIGLFLVLLKGYCPVFGIYQVVPSLIVGVRIILHGRIPFSLTGLGFGCVGLASVQPLVSPRRFGGASYHWIYSLFSDMGEDFKLGHYPCL